MGLALLQSFRRPVSGQSWAGQPLDLGTDKGKPLSLRIRPFYSGCDRGQRLGSPLSLVTLTPQQCFDQLCEPDSRAAACLGRRFVNLGPNCLPTTTTTVLWRLCGGMWRSVSVPSWGILSPSASSISQATVWAVLISKCPKESGPVPVSV